MEEKALLYELILFIFPMLFCNALCNKKNTSF